MKNGRRVYVCVHMQHTHIHFDLVWWIRTGLACRGGIYMYRERERKENENESRLGVVAA